MTNQVLAIIGSIIALLLSVNAYYFKDIVKQLKSIELQLVKLVTEHDVMSRLIDHHEKQIDDIKEKMHKQNNIIHSLYSEHPRFKDQ